MTRDGKSEASCCFASWMLEANWIVPASMRLLPCAKLNLQNSNHLSCSEHANHVQAIDMLIMTTRSNMFLQSNIPLCFNTKHNLQHKTQPNCKMQNNMCMLVVVGILAEQAVHPFIHLCYVGTMLQTLTRHVSCSFVAMAF
jgi:hypothetical protein